MHETTQRLGQALARYCRTTTTPVAVKLAAAGETPPERIAYPSAKLGHPLAVCQGMTIARTMGWTMGFGAGDHACPLPRVFMGHVAPERFLEGGIAGFYQDDPECMRAMEASYPRWPLGRWQEVWLAPVDRCDFAPDVVVVYGSPAQVLAMIHGANFGVGTGVASLSTGRYGCSLWLAGAVQSGQCTYMVPGPGERIFAGTGEHEMSFAIPAGRMERFMEGLAYVAKKGSYRYPVPNMGALAAPAIPKKYWSIDPEAGGE